jgi:TolB-like protein
LDVLTYTTQTAPLLGYATVTVAYQYAKQYTSDSLTTGIQERYMRFEGLNTAEDNQPVIINVFKFSIDPLKELAMISDTFAQFVLEGSVLRDGLQLTGSKYFQVITLS